MRWSGWRRRPGTAADRRSSRSPPFIAVIMACRLAGGRHLSDRWLHECREPCRCHAMHDANPLLLSQIVVRICLFLVAAIAMFGGTVQFFLGQPDTTPRLDNVHRFMAGVYFATGLISLWAGITIRQQATLVYLLALGVLLAGSGRLLSMSRVGLPK